MRIDGWEDELNTGTYLETVDMSSSEPMLVMRRAGRKRRTQVFEISRAEESERSFHLEAMTPYEMVSRTASEAWSAPKKETNVLLEEPPIAVKMTSFIFANGERVR